jgi:hypothetical protein
MRVVTGHDFSRALLQDQSRKAIGEIKMLLPWPGLPPETGRTPALLNLKQANA